MSYWSCSSSHNPYWFILSEKTWGISASLRLEIADRFVLLLNNLFFFLASPGFYLFIFVFLLTAADWTGLDLLQGFTALKTGFGWPFISVRSPLLFFLHLSLLHPGFTPVYFFFYSAALQLNHLQKISKGMSGVFFFAMEARITGGETLWSSPQGEGRPCRTINSKSCAQDIFQRAKMESCVC